MIVERKFTIAGTEWIVRGVSLGKPLNRGFSTCMLYDRRIKN